MSSGGSDVRTTTCFDKYNFACVNTNVKDADVITAFAVYIFLAFLLLASFGLLRHNIPIYSGRCYLSSLNVAGNAPPPLPKLKQRKKENILKYWFVHVFGWVSHVMNVSDTELVNSSGLDALVFLRVAQFGTQLFLPITVLGLIMLCPIHISQSFYIDSLRETYVNSTDAVNSGENYLMGLTIANIEPMSGIFWVHVLFSWLITLYTLWLLKHHYRSYEFLRQVYGSSTGECNVWRTMHLPQTTLQRLLQQGTNETAEFGINVLQPIEKQEEYDVENRMSGDQGGLDKTSSGDVGDGSVRKGVTNPFLSTVSKTLAEIADIVSGPSDYEENDYSKFSARSDGRGGIIDQLQTQRSGMSNFSTGSEGRRSAVKNNSANVADESWPILLEAMLGPGLSRSVISPRTSGGGDFPTPMCSENRFSTPVASINADPNNFNRRSSLPTSPTGTMVENSAQERSHPEKNIDDRENISSKLNSPESNASPTSVSSDASRGSENTKNSGAKFNMPRASLDLRLSNYVTTRPKGSDVASRYHKSEKQHLTKREERERQKRQLFQERQELAKRDEENDSDTYSTRKRVIPAPIAIPRPTGRESGSETPGELSTASSMGPLSPLSPPDALEATPDSFTSKNVHNTTASIGDLPLKLRRPESPNPFLRMPSAENLNEGIIQGFNNTNKSGSFENLESSGNVVRTELQVLQENISQIVEDFTDYDELEDTHSIAHNWWVGLDIAETVWANNNNVKNSENLWDDVECGTCGQDGENNIPCTPTRARGGGLMHKSSSKDIELQYLSPHIRSDDSYGQDLSDLAEKAMMNDNASSSRTSPHPTPSKGISHHVVTPTKGAEAASNLLFPNPSSAQNTPTRKAHRRRPSGMDFENEKVKTQTMEAAAGVYDDSYQFAKCCPVPSVDDRRFVSAVHFVDADELEEEFAGEGDFQNNGDINIQQQRERIVSVLVQNYCVLMTDVGDSQGRGDPWDDLQHVEKFFRGLFGADFLRIIPLHDHERVDYLLTLRDEIKNSRDRLMMTRRIGDMYERAGTGSKASNRREFLTKRLKTIDAEILRERRAALFKGPGPSCVIAFRSQYAAACAAQCRITSRGGSFQIQPAPGPDDINWQTVLLRKKERNRRSLFVLPLIAIIIFIPMGTLAGVLNTLCANDVTSSSASEATTLEFMNWYCKSEDAGVVRVIVGSILPPILLTLWETFIMSFGLLYLVQAQTTHVSLSKTDQQFTKFYFLWAFMNIFLGTVSGFAFERYLTALQTEGPDEMLTLLGSSLPLTSNFFLIWILFRGIYLPSQRLIFPHPGVLCMAVNKFCCCLGCAVTPRDRTVKYSPRSVRAGREVGVFVMVMLIGLVFAPVAPMISLLSTIFFVFNFIIWRYHILYVYDKTYESSGSMWQTVTDLTIYALLIAQSFLSFVLLSKRAYAPSLVLWVTSVPVLMQNKAKFRMRHEKLKWAVPLPHAAVAPRVEFDPVAYWHPALNENSFGWHPDVGKVWRGYKDVTSKRAFGRKFRYNYYNPPS